MVDEAIPRRLERRLALRGACRGGEAEVELARMANGRNVCA